jgi:hypothetical protein
MTKTPPGATTTPTINNTLLEAVPQPPLDLSQLVTS